MAPTLQFLHLTEDIMNPEMTDPQASEEKYSQRLRWWIGCFVAIAVLFLWQEHRAHLLGVLPWLLLLASPAMHFFMHRRHGSHHGSQQSEPGDSPEWILKRRYAVGEITREEHARKLEELRH